MCATLKAYSCLVERERRAAERERRATLSFEPPMPLSPPLLLAPSTRPLASAASSRLDCCLPCRAGQARKKLPCALPPLPSYCSQRSQQQSSLKGHWYGMRTEGVPARDPLPLSLLLLSLLHILCPDAEASDAFACSDAAAAGKSEEVMKRRTSGVCDTQVEICSKKSKTKKQKHLKHQGCDRQRAICGVIKP